MLDSFFKITRLTSMDELTIGTFLIRTLNILKLENNFNFRQNIQKKINNTILVYTNNKNISKTVSYFIT